MDSLISFFVFCQVFGAFVGALTAVWGELAYMRAIRDGVVGKAEEAHLKVIWHGLYFGMTLILLSSLGLIVIAYVTESSSQPALSPSYWILVTFALLIIGAAWALAKKHLTYAAGSALMFAGWWFLLYFNLGWLPLLSWSAAIAFFTVASVVFYALLTGARHFALRKH